MLDVKRQVELVADRALMDPAAPRSARIEVRLRDGRTVTDSRGMRRARRRIHSTLPA